MISVSEASALILSHPFKPKKEKVDIGDSTGRVLSEPLVADRDFPPFDRITMDGVAIASNEFERGTRKFKVSGVQAPGQAALKITGSKECIEVMTGAMLPEGTDTVVPYEEIEIKDGCATVLAAKVSKRGNIHFKSVDAKENEILLTPGLKISAAEIALLASVGKKMVDVYAFPKTAIISTGDELVAIDQLPLPYQIRRSNHYAVEAAIRELGGRAHAFHLTDQKEVLQKELSAILENHELIILTGGVSKGKFDFIPEALNSMGIKKHFHRISQRPGKPFWFGTSDRHTVFALPGNPVSTYLCFYRYIRPWLLKCFGAPFSFSPAILARDFSFELELTYFLQVRIENEKGKLMAYPDPGHGSGDFANLKSVDGFLELPAHKTEFNAGEIFPYIPFR